MARSTVAVRFTGDTADLKRSLDQVDGKMRGLGSGMATFGKVAAAGMAAAGVGAVALGKSFVDAAVESQKITKQTEAVIKSMGGAANVTAGEVAKLSEKLSMQSGVDDELIQSGQNVLLTFGNVQNAIGDGPKVFDRATKAALDMSVALGTDMSSASMMVGKALNDPIDGISKLSRSGIQFTDEQKEQIKTMQEAGDMAGAQAVMLAELERQFGGSAEAQATAGDKLKVVWGNLQEQLGAKLLPVVEKVATFLANNLPRAMDALGRVIGPLINTASMFFNTLRTGFTEDEGTKFELFALKIRAALQNVAAFVQEWWPKVVAGFQAVVAFVQQHWPEIERIILSVVETVVTVVSGAVSVITTLWDNFGNNILSFVQRVWPPIQQVISGVMEAIRGIIQTVTALIQGDWSRVWEGVKQIFSGVWSAIQGIVKAALEGVRLAVGVALEVIGSVFKGAWEGIVNWFSTLPARVGRIASSIWEALKEGLAAAIRWIGRKLDDLLGPLDEIAGKVGGVVGKLGGAAGSVLGGLGGLLAEGGPARAGVPYIVGERGPELFVPNSSGTVVANGRFGMAGGGTVINLNVSVDRTMDPGQVGKQLVEAISAYERRSGSGWRS